MNNKTLVKENQDIQMVQFNDVELMAVKLNDNNKIYVAVSYVCNGIGLSEKQKDRQVANIQEDVILKQGTSNLRVPTNSGIQKALCIELDYLPLWLAKISITPKMKKDNPEIVEKLVEYQLKAKDVLAKAFIKQSSDMVQEYLSLTEEERAIKYFQKLKDEKLLIEQTKVLKEHNQELKESKNVLDALCNSDKLIDMGKFSKALDIKGFGRNNMLQYFRDKKILQKGEYTKNIPYQNYTKWFKVTSFKCRNTNVNRFMTWVKWDAVEAITKYLIKDGLLPFGYEVDMREFEFDEPVRESVNCKEIMDYYLNK